MLHSARVQPANSERTVVSGRKATGAILAVLMNSSGDLAGRNNIIIGISLQKERNCWYVGLQRNNVRVVW